MPDSNEVFRILIPGLDINIIPIFVNEVEIHFEDIDSSEKYQDFNGIIIFQSVFNNSPAQVVRRQKEIELCLRKGGFICYMHSQIGLNDNDMLHYVFNRYHLAFIPAQPSVGSPRMTRMHCKYDQFRAFIDNYGATGMQFFIPENLDDNIIHIISEVEETSIPTGIVLNGNQFFLPTRLPDIEEYNEYFLLLANSLIAFFKKMRIELPIWVDEIKTNKEQDLITKRNELIQDLTILENKIDIYKIYKRILVTNDDNLIDAVMKVLEEGLGLHVKNVGAELKEDIQIVKGDIAEVFIEVKGTNKGVKREHINQTDSHRERAGFNSDFPAILIMNIFNGSNNLEGKNREIASEQIIHAVNIKILIVRTLDLFRLLELVEKNVITSNDVLETFKTRKGWLKVGETIEILEQ